MGTKLAANYLAFVKLACIRLWLSVNENTERLIAFNRARLKAAGENPDDEMREMGFSDEDFARWDALATEATRKDLSPRGGRDLEDASD